MAYGSLKKIIDDKKKSNFLRARNRFKIKFEN